MSQGFYIDALDALGYRVEWLDQRNARAGRWYATATQGIAPNRTFLWSYGSTIPNVLAALHAHALAGTNIITETGPETSKPAVDLLGLLGISSPAVDPANIATVRRLR